MRTLMRAGCVIAVLLWSASIAQADPFSFLADGTVVFNTSLSTQGTFRCRGPLACSGTGTNSITFGSGDNHATITFTGVNTSLQVGNHTTPVTLGVFETDFSPGFIFPERLSTASPLLNFILQIEHTSPVTSSRTKLFTGRPGGAPDLPLSAAAGTSNIFSIPLSGVDTPGFHYTFLVYSLHLPVIFSGAGPSNLTADVGATPEPASLILLTTGLAGAAWSRRRRRA